MRAASLPRALEKPIVARTAPPAAQVGFAAQKPQLAQSPGKPLDDAARRQLKPAAPVPAPVLRVVTPERKAPPPTAIPPAASAGKAPEARAKPAAQRPEQQRGKPEPRERPAAAPPAPAEKQPAPKAEPRGRRPDPSADKPKGKDKDDEEDGKDERKKKN